MIEQFERFGAVAVSLTDAGDGPVLEPAPGETALWERLNVQALFPLDADVGAIRRRLAVPFEVEFVGDEDWLQSWRQHVVERRFGEVLLLTSRDAEVDSADASRAVLRMDPGLAFGSGGHATTALCLEWLAAHAADDITRAAVLDYGCGSGILSNAAALLGAARVVAVDYDEQALTATRDNAAFNGVSRCVTAVRNNPQPEQFDVVIANILAGTLVALAEDLCAYTAPGGQLVLSGILTSQSEWVRSAYPRVDFQPSSVEDGWVLLHGTHR